MSSHNYLSTHNWNCQKNHDKLVDIVQERMTNNGWDTKKFWHYDKGEIDLFAYRQKDWSSIDQAYDNKTILLFEMKSQCNRHSRKHAVEQLKRAKEVYFNSEYRVFAFYVTFDKNRNVKYEWIRFPSEPVEKYLYD